VLPQWDRIRASAGRLGELGSSHPKAPALSGPGAPGHRQSPATVPIAPKSITSATATICNMHIFTELLYSHLEHRTMMPFVRFGNTISIFFQKIDVADCSLSSSVVETDLGSRLFRHLYVRNRVNAVPRIRNQ
jgi:hypothetical protein